MTIFIVNGWRQVKKGRIKSLKKFEIMNLRLLLVKHQTMNYKSKYSIVLKMVGLEI